MRSDEVGLEKNTRTCRKNQGLRAGDTETLERSRTASYSIALCTNNHATMMFIRKRNKNTSLCCVLSAVSCATSDRLKGVDEFPVTAAVAVVQVYITQTD